MQGDCVCGPGRYKQSVLPIILARSSPQPIPRLMLALWGLVKNRLVQ